MFIIIYFSSHLQIQHMHTVSVLTSKQVKVVGEEQLEAKEGENDLKRERAAIDKVPIEQLHFCG